jgi:hypothetical protein
MKLKMDRHGVYVIADGKLYRPYVTHAQEFHACLNSTRGKSFTVIEMGETKFKAGDDIKASAISSSRGCYVRRTDWKKGQYREIWHLHGKRSYWDHALRKSVPHDTNTLFRKAEV